MSSSSVGTTLKSPAMMMGLPVAMSDCACSMRRSNHASLYWNFGPGWGLPFGRYRPTTATPFTAASMNRACLSLGSPGSSRRISMGSKPRASSATPFHVFWPTTRQLYPAASSSDLGKAAVSVFSSWRTTMSGLVASSQASSCGRRLRTLLTFHVASRMASRLLVRLQVGLDCGRLVADSLDGRLQLIRSAAELLRPAANFVVLAEVDTGVVLPASLGLVVGHRVVS